MISRLLLILVALVLISGALWMLWVGWGGLWESARVLKRVRAARTWPTAQGVVQSSIIIEESGQESILYTPAIRYTYVVAGIEHTGTQVSFGGPLEFKDQEFAQAITRRYPEGATVPVYYKRDEPNVAVIESGVSNAVITGLALSGGLVAAGLVALVGIAVFALTYLATS